MQARVASSDMTDDAHAAICALADAIDELAPLVEHRRPPRAPRPPPRAPGTAEGSERFG